MDLDDIGSEDGRFRHPSSARLGFPSRNDEAVKASLAAVRAAREAARQRRRRQGWTARVGLLGLLGVGLAAWPSAHRLYKNHRAKVARSAALAPAAPPATTASRPGAAPSSGSPTAPTLAARFAPTTSPVIASASSLPAATTVADPAAVEEAVTACHEAYAAHQWHVAADRCADAFGLAPERAEIALKAAKAQHARGRFAESETWAATTLKLDPGSAEAFAIIARAERRAGHAPEATAAYRKYLALAPRGWHAREARRALRLDGEGTGTRGASSGEPATAPLPERSSEPVRDSSSRPVPPTVSQAE